MVLALSAPPARFRFRTHLVKSRCMRQPFRTESFLNTGALRVVSLLAAVVVGCLGLIVTTFICPCMDFHLPLGTANAASLRAHRLTARAIEAEVVETKKYSRGCGDTKYSFSQGLVIANWSILSFPFKYNGR